MSPDITRRLGIGALVAGGAAALAGSPYRKHDGRLDIDATIRLIGSGGDHVGARQLAAWIRDRKPDLRVIDVRSSQQFAEFSIPTAENLPLSQLMRVKFAPHETLVLYSEGGAHAGQAWMLLRASGVSNAYFIAGGLADWQDEVMAPVLAPGADHDAELSRYFGGQPSFGEVLSPGPLTRRRGC